MTGPAFDRVLEALHAAGRRVTTSGPGRIVAQCPAHEDGRPSLSVRAGDGQALLYCFAGCTADDVRHALGLSWADLYDNPRGLSWDYDDGRTVHRTPDKRFTQSGNTKSTPVLYRLAAVRDAVASGAPVYLTEGEKDAATLHKLAGVTATTAPQGAVNFAKVDATPLAGASVVAVVDRDAAGDRWAAAVRDKLAGVAASVRFVRAAAGKDAADHLAAGLDLDALEPYAWPDAAPLEDAPEDDDEPPASWAAVDLGPFLDGSHEPTRPTLLPRADGVCLVYPGLTHSFHGESESGKSLLLQVEAVRLIMAGERVLFVDFESDAASVVGRLLEFGATPDALRAGLVYVRPEVRPDTARELAAWLDVLSGPYALAIVDGVTDSLGLFGYSTKDNDDVAAWQRALPRRIIDRTGAAVAVVDHVTKDSESRGRFAIGGQAKLSGLSGAAYTVEVSRPLGRGLRGVIVLRVGKDRPGYVRRHGGPMRASDRTQEVARVTIDSTGPAPVVTVEPWKGHGSDPDAPPARWRPTGIMERLSTVLEASAEPLSFRALDDMVTGKADAKRTALAELAAAGHITITPGARGANLHASVTPYREAEDPASDDYHPRDTVGTEPTPQTPAIECVPVSLPNTGERDTHTQHPLTVSGTQSGHGGDTVTQTPANGSGTQSGPDGTRWGLEPPEPPEPPENLPTRDLPTAPRTCHDCGAPVGVNRVRCLACINNPHHGVTP